jgi:DASS family divalent anion:Na+ symporter
MCCAYMLCCCCQHLQGFEKTGLGERIANNLLTVCGSSSLQLALGLAAAEVFITPAMPSTTARAAGIFMPVIKSVSQAVGSMPGAGRSATRCRVVFWVAGIQFAHAMHDCAVMCSYCGQGISLASAFASY